MKRGNTLLDRKNGTQPAGKELQRCLCIITRCIQSWIRYLKYGIAYIQRIRLLRRRKQEKKEKEKNKGNNHNNNFNNNSNLVVLASWAIRASNKLKRLLLKARNLHYLERTEKLTITIILVVMLVLLRITAALVSLGQKTKAREKSRGRILKSKRSIWFTKITSQTIWIITISMTITNLTITTFTVISLKVTEHPMTCSSSLRA